MLRTQEANAQNQLVMQRMRKAKAAKDPTNSRKSQTERNCEGRGCKLKSHKSPHVAYSQPFLQMRPVKRRLQKKKKKSLRQRETSYSDFGRVSERPAWASLCSTGVFSRRPLGCARPGSAAVWRSAHVEDRMLGSPDRAGFSAQWPDAGNLLGRGARIFV